MNKSMLRPPRAAETARVRAPLRVAASGRQRTAAAPAKEMPPPHASLRAVLSATCFPGTAR